MPEPNDDHTESVELPQSVVDRIQDRLPETEFDSVDDYAAAALDGLLRELDATPATARPGTDADGVDDVENHDVDDAERDEVVDAEDAQDAEVEDVIADRLAALGYR